MGKLKSIKTEVGKHTLKMAGRVTANIKYAFSPTHFSAAKLFTVKCYELEKSLDKSSFLLNSNEIRGYVTGTIVLSVAGLEAYINELYLHLRDDGLMIEGGEFPDYITEGKSAVQKTNWNKLEHKPILIKYERFLDFARVPSLKTTREYKHADDLIFFRNRFIHYIPEWDSEKADTELEKRYEDLDGQVNFNSFYSEEAPYFPRKCFTYDFAQWAVNAAIDYIKLFGFVLGIENNYEQYKVNFK